MANEPRLLRELLGHVFEHLEHVHVIGTVRELNRLPLLVELFRPDWVVMTLPQTGEQPDMARELIRRSANTGIVAVAEQGEGTQAWFCGQTVMSDALDDLLAIIQRSGEDSQYIYCEGNPRA
jgi:hypothetical protein